MDRRRFVPRPEGLELRELLSTVKPAVATTATTATPVKASDPNIGPLRQIRIDRLPNYFQQIRSGRTIPADLIQNLQDDLRAIEGQLTPPPNTSLQAFNRQLRTMLSRSSLSPASAHTINDYFTKVLLRSNANPVVAARFASHMNELARLNAQRSNASVLTAGDYGLVMQLSMGIGINLPTSKAVPQGPRATSN